MINIIDSILNLDYTNIDDSLVNDIIWWKIYYSSREIIFTLILGFKYFSQEIVWFQSLGFAKKYPSHKFFCTIDQWVLENVSYIRETYLEYASGARFKVKNSPMQLNINKIWNQSSQRFVIKLGEANKFLSPHTYSGAS